MSDQRLAEHRVRSSNDPRAWEPGEVDAALDPSLTAVDVAARTKRSLRAVYRMRSKLGVTDAKHASYGTRNPWTLGGRRLLARTCRSCGLLLDTHCFVVHHKVIEHECKACRPRNGESQGVLSARAAEQKQEQQDSEQTANRSGQPYIERDLIVLADCLLTQSEKAKRLGRTFYAVGGAVRAYGFQSNQPASKTIAEGQSWQINSAASSR